LNIQEKLGKALQKAKDLYGYDLTVANSAKGKVEYYGLIVKGYELDMSKADSVGKYNKIKSKRDYFKNKLDAAQIQIDHIDEDKDWRN